MTIDFELSPMEIELYVMINNYLKKEILYALPNSHRTLITSVIRKLLASSSMAVAETFKVLKGRLEILKETTRTESADESIDFFLSFFDDDEIETDDDSKQDELYTREKATATELKRLVLRGKNTSYDSQNSTYKAEDYAFSKLKERYKKWTGNSFDDKDLISFGLVNEQGNLTNAGALLADESPIRCSRLFCTRWNGLNKSGGAVDALDDAEYSGSVISLIENGEAFIKRNCKMKWRKTANSREEMPEYVERSYHEALVNALAHRDYLVNGSEVHIDIYDDRMEIYSPGGMPDGSMIQDRDPLMVPSTRRNPVLADVFNRLGYMERKGSGFGKIISGYEFQINYDESKRPSFRSDRYQFTVVMPNLNYDVSHDFEENETMSESMSEAMSESMSKLERTRMQIILHYLDTNKEINSSIAAKLLKVEIKTASRLLLKGEKLDILNSYGKTKNKVYFRE
jgi:ATP-dependent DNA helicase RecG